MEALLSKATPTVEMNNIQIQQVYEHKHLGIILQHDGLWSAQIEAIKEKASKRIDILRRHSATLDRKSLEKL